MKKAFIAAITASAIAGPATAQDNNNDVFDCLTGKLDEQIETLQGVAEEFAKPFKEIFGATVETSLEVAYSDEDKMEWIAECEDKTGQTATDKSRGMTSYSNNSGIKLIFEP